MWVTATWHTGTSPFTSVSTFTTAPCWLPRMLVRSCPSSSAHHCLPVCCLRRGDASSVCFHACAVPLPEAWLSWRARCIPCKQLALRVALHVQQARPLCSGRTAAWSLMCLERGRVSGRLHSHVRHPGRAGGGWGTSRRRACRARQLARAVGVPALRPARPEPEHGGGGRGVAALAGVVPGSVQVSGHAR